MRHLTSFTEHAESMAFVPTMGALHDGHLALIKLARQFSEKVLVSIYVNPTQFESADDLAKYPKSLANDLELAASAGADWVWTPSVDEIYPEGIENVELIPAGPVGDLYEGASRPNHFSGVLTVINRLFSITKPRYAVFGEKDYQQLFLIKKFAQERFPEIKIINGETIRDTNEIALSSRNSRLTSVELEVARVLPTIQREVKSTHCICSTEIREVAHKVVNAQSGFTLDYVEVVDPATLLPVSDDFQGLVQVLFAGWIGSVRLIDNFSYEVKGQK